ncbi:MAG: alpha/beta fold hydrolase [Candidatus Binatia bacterium]
MQKLNRAGIALCFTEAGSGSPPLLFVHGWTCDHTFFGPQFEYFGRVHRVVAVDLRGHGESDKPQQDYSMAAFADDLAWLCAQIGLQKPVIIGHSMGGLIALEFSARHPELPAAIVTVDSPILPPEGAFDPVAPFVAALRTPAYQEAQRQFIEQMLFLPTDDPARKARIVEVMSRAPQHVMASAFENIVRFDQAGPAAACKVPWLALFATHVFTDMPRLRAVCPHVITGQTVGAGHFHQLEVPEQVNAMIERFLAVSLPQ